MAHPFKHEHEAARGGRIERIAGKHDDKAADEKMIRSAIKQHDAQLHGGKETKLKFANGGAVPDGETTPRMDKPSRGKGKTTVNVVIAPQSAPQAPAMPPIPPAALAAAAQGAGPGGPAIPPPPMRKRDGAVYTAGAGTGEGREEKIKNYGKRK